MEHVGDIRGHLGHFTANKHVEPGGTLGATLLQDLDGQPADLTVLVSVDGEGFGADGAVNVGLFDGSKSGHRSKRLTGVLTGNDDGGLPLFLTLTLGLDPLVGNVFRVEGEVGEGGSQLLKLTGQLRLVHLLRGLKLTNKLDLSVFLELVEHVVHLALDRLTVEEHLDVLGLLFHGGLLQFGASLHATLHQRILAGTVTHLCLIRLLGYRLWLWIA